MKMLLIFITMMLSTVFIFTSCFADVTLFGITVGKTLPDEIKSRVHLTGSKYTIETIGMFPFEAETSIGFLYPRDPTTKVILLEITFRTKDYPKAVKWAKSIFGGDPAREDVDEILSSSGTPIKQQTLYWYDGNGYEIRLDDVVTLAEFARGNSESGFYLRSDLGRLRIIRRY